MKKRIAAFTIFAACILTFIISACQKTPTKCPPYIDLSLDREIAISEKIFPEAERISAEDIAPENVYIVDSLLPIGGGRKEIVYITPDNVLYLVDYRADEVDGELLRYITKIAVREGDRYIYKVDNWSGDGLMVAEYCDIYYDYFNKYKESQGLHTQQPYTADERPYPKQTDYIDLSGKRQVKQMDRVLETDFSAAENPLELAQQFVPEGATVYFAGANGKGNEIIYITAEGVFYREIYNPSGIYGKTVIISAKMASDNYIYIKQINSDNEVTYIHHTPRQDGDKKLSKEYFDIWRKERGLVPVPNAPSEFSRIYKSTPQIWFLEKDK